MFDEMKQLKNVCFNTEIQQQTQIKLKIKKRNSFKKI